MHSIRLLSVAIIVTTLSNNVFYNCYAESDPDPDILATDLIEWLRANGAYINEKLVVKHVVPGDPSSPRGVFATEAMEADEKLCTIPGKLIVKSREELMVGLHEDMTYCGAIKTVMEATSGDDIMPYGRYLNAQPNGYLPTFWSRASKDLLLEMLMSTRTEQLTAYDELPPHGVDGLEELEQNCKGDIGDPLYLQAAMLVQARSDYDVMVPFYDMINHDNGKYNIRHTIDPEKWYTQIDEEGYEMVTTKAIHAGGQLYNSYNRCNICVHRDWLGTPEMFLNFGFVESMPQRWLFDFARVKFELDWKDQDESTREIMVKFLVPPSRKGMDMLRLELRRLESFSKEYRDGSYEEYEGVSEYEWQMIWQYYDALHDALSYALQSGATLSDEVWDLDDDWWVEDGPLKAADVDEHYVHPTRSEKMSYDEL